MAKAGAQALGNLQPRYDAYMKNQLPMLESIPNYYMEEFSPDSAFTRFNGTEILQILIDAGLDMNYIVPSDNLPLLLSVLSQDLKSFFLALVSESGSQGSKIQASTQSTGINPNVSSNSVKFN